MQQLIVKHLDKITECSDWNGKHYARNKSKYTELSWIKKTQILCYPTKRTEQKQFRQRGCGLELFSITGFLQCKVNWRVLPQFQFRRKNSTNTGIHTDWCGSCNTHQHHFEAGVHWFLNWATEGFSPVHISSKQNLHLCGEAHTPHFVQSFELNSLLSWELEIWTHPFMSFSYSSLSG